MSRNSSELSSLLEPVKLGSIQMNNRVVMAPMTRSRASNDDLVGDMHVCYYEQRASAGLIITEGVHPSAVGKGYCRTPGLYNQAQVDAWRRVTDAVHARGGKIVCQLMHCGRVGHPDNKAPGVEAVAPSAIAAKGKIFTETGMQTMMQPRALETDEIAGVIAEYVQATRLALAAGFDGVELHCASGYLPAQFLSTGTNQRDDQYGGSLANRIRFVVEVIEAICAVAGVDRVGIRICPGNPFNDLSDDNPEETFEALLRAIDHLGLAYLHVIRMDAGVDNIALAHRCFSGPVILNESYQPAEAAAAIRDGLGVAVSFGRAYIANPDLVERIEAGAELAAVDFSTLYAAGPEGFIDYPPMARTDGE